MADPSVDELLASTKRFIYPQKVIDLFFLNTPLLAYIRKNCMKEFTGGRLIEGTVMYAPLIGGFYFKGDTFNTTARQILAAIQFDPKYSEVSIPFFKEDIQVLNKGPEAFLSLMDIKLENAMDTLSAIWDIALMNHGLASATNIVGSRAQFVNGFIEAFNDGITPSWEGSIFASYGQQLRNGVISSALNSPAPYFCGNSAGAVGPFSYPVIEETYRSCVIGGEAPDIGIGSRAIISFLLERTQPQQRFTQEADPNFGFESVMVHRARVMEDEYFPSLIYGKNDPDLGNYLTSTFTSPASSDSSAFVVKGSNMPASTVINVGEVFMWLNTKHTHLFISDDSEFGGGFSGYKPAQDNTKVVGQVFTAGNLMVDGPRYGRIVMGIGS